MKLQLDSIYTEDNIMLQILTMDEQTENYQGQHPRGRRGVRMHGGRVQR